MLHECLDELFADAVTHGGLNTNSTIMDLINWSFEQTQKIDHEN